jgi:hypothetical protein
MQDIYFPQHVSHRECNFLLMQIAIIGVTSHLVDCMIHLNDTEEIVGLKLPNTIVQCNYFFH